MGSIQGPERRGILEKNVLVSRINRLFKIDPVKVKARDSSSETILVEHRIGKEGGVYTANALMDKLGLEKEYYDYVSELEKKFKDRKRFEALSTQFYRGQKDKMTRITGKYRRFLETFYGNYPRPLLPMFAFVPVSDKTDGIYIQGLLDLDTLKLVVGTPDDDALWAETVFTKTKRFADLNQRARKTARALSAMPGINKDVSRRMLEIAQGNVPEHRLMFQEKPE